ncbi:MAG: hypothetical protein ACYC1I_05470 [Acidimicrobiales bacterium]
MSPRDFARRAQRLTSLYPKAWRDRYGEEFEAHLEQEFEETPYSLTRTLNVVMKGLFTRAKGFTWRVILMQPGDGKFRAGVLIPIAAMIGIAIATFSGWPIRGHRQWPANVLIGVLFAFAIFNVMYDSHRMQTNGPAKRLSKDRLVPLAIVATITLPYQFNGEIGHAWLAPYVIVPLDLLLFAYKFGWIGRRHKSSGLSTNSDAQGTSKI